MLINVLIERLPSELSDSPDLSRTVKPDCLGEVDAQFDEHTE